MTKSNQSNCRNTNNQNNPSNRNSPNNYLFHIQNRVYLGLRLLRRRLSLEWLRDLLERSRLWFFLSLLLDPMEIFQNDQRVLDLAMEKVRMSKNSS